ncbi:MULTISPECIES: TetR family transcriptional regulator [Virgibacillus]|uniref:TetR family transcriptional regulator n=1 Tax=Virgibacillus salarius TaxID=447199 RepID=A0A941DUU9_9BACI|nr:MULTISPECIES: TetR family transcriptional regulator [Bacillaceae]MBR7797095.1 TetR family transcriptional regulator [Virgibacillus salarius]NAZ09804.1 TetR family transcriptional regulator [Agaribacter marinus]
MDNKKEKITKSAIHVFREKGIEKTKVSDIVKGAGIAQGTFYLYFPSKLAVMPSIAEVMVERIVEEMERKVNRETAFTDQLGQVVSIIFDLTKEYREIFALIFAGLASSDYLSEWEKIYEPYYAWMQEFLEQPKAASKLRDSIDINGTAKLLIGLIESAAEQSYLYDQQDEESAKQKQREVLEFALHALCK